MSDSTSEKKEAKVDDEKRKNIHPSNLVRRDEIKNERRDEPGLQNEGRMAFSEHARRVEINNERRDELKK